MLFAYPKSARYGRVIPKSKIYKNAVAKTTLKARFVSEVEQVVWAYKLAPETINLTATKDVEEIQIFTVRLHSNQVSKDVLWAMDRPIPYPLIFELAHRDKRQTVVAFKRPSEANKTKSVVSEYFCSDWVSASSERLPLPPALDLATLYSKLLTALMPFAPKVGENIQAYVKRVEAIRVKELEVAKLKDQLVKEKQFNQRVEINKALRRAKQELVQLKVADSQLD